MSKSIYLALDTKIATTSSTFSGVLSGQHGTVLESLKNDTKLNKIDEVIGGLFLAIFRNYTFSKFTFLE